MQLNVKKFLEEAGITEPFYPGKRLVKSYRQPGEYKSHCVVLDWRNPDKIRIEIKAGLSGRGLETKKLKHYPVCFQSPTYVDVEIVNENERQEDDEDEEEGKSSKGKGGGGKQPAKKSLEDMKDVAASAFGSIIEGAVPEIGKIVEMMVMGTEIAKESFGAVLGKMAEQMQHGKIIATEMLSKAGDFVTKYEPPSFMKKTGEETASYSYDREKNADIGFKQSLG